MRQIPNSNFSFSAPIKYRRAFTLLELLLSIAIIGVLFSLGIVSVRGISGGSNLATSGSRVAGLLESAREEAILKRQPVAVVLLTTGAEARRTFSALEYDGASWNQISRWETLPTGIIAAKTSATDNSLAEAFSTTTSVTVSPALPPLKCRGVSYAPGSYDYLIFMPDGSLYQVAKSCALSLVEGVWNGSDIQKVGNTANSLQIVVNDATGRVKVIRP